LAWRVVAARRSNLFHPGPVCDRTLLATCGTNLGESLNRLVGRAIDRGQGQGVVGGVPIVTDTADPGASGVPDAGFWFITWLIEVQRLSTA
jgi:hypothetical protein